MVLRDSCSNQPERVSRVLIYSHTAESCLPPSRRRRLLCRPAPAAGR